MIKPPGEAPDLAQHHDALGLGEQDEGEDQHTLQWLAADEVGGGLPPGRKQQERDGRQAHRGRVRLHAERQSRDHLGANHGKDAVNRQRGGQQDDQPARRREREAPLEGGGQRRVGGGEEDGGDEEAEVGGNAEHAPGVLCVGSRLQDARGVDAVDREDPAHRHEAEAKEEDAILRDLHGGDRQQDRQPERQQGDHRDDEEVLARHDDARVARRVRGEPGEDAGGEEEGTQPGRRTSPFEPGARDDGGGGHSDVTARIPAPCPSGRAGRQPNGARSR